MNHTMNIHKMFKKKTNFWDLGISVFNTFRYLSEVICSTLCPTVWGTAWLFQRVCTILHSHQWSMRVLFSHPQTTLLLFFIIILTILVDVKRYLLVDLACIFLMDDVEQLFMFMVVIGTFALETYSLRSFVHCFIGVFVFSLLSWKISSYFFLVINSLPDI